MSLRQLLARKRLVVLGMNSGTSADGLDLAVLQITTSPQFAIKSLAGKCVPYPSKLREAVLRLSDAGSIRLEEIVYLDNLLGQFYGTQAARYINFLKKRGIAVDAVASHGQTVRHLPSKGKYLSQTVNGTLQIGSLSIIAALTGKTVVGDFRQADVALGNEGAPITVAAMAKMFGHATKSRLILNIGGMANYFYFPAGRRFAGIKAADTGAGNVVADMLCRKLYGIQFDRNGRHASRGMVSRALFQFASKQTAAGRSTQSTGRETYGSKLADQIISQGRKLKLSKDDIIATGLELTVEGVRRHLMPLFRADRTIDKLYLTGGGVHNSFLVERLRQVLAPCEVTSVAELGVDPDLVEASAYAVMGEACLRSKALPTRFSGNRSRLQPVSGTIAQPPANPSRR